MKENLKLAGAALVLVLVVVSIAFSLVAEIARGITWIKWAWQ